MKAITNRLVGGRGGMVSNNPGHLKVLENVCLVGTVLTSGGLAVMKTQGLRGLGLPSCALSGSLHANQVPTGPPLPCCVRTFQFEEQSARACENSGWSPAGLPQTPGPHSSRREPGLLAQHPQGYPLFSLWGYLQPQNFSFWTLPSLGTQFSSKLPHSEIVPVLFPKYL